MARRAAGERDLRQAINANDSLRAAYGQVFDNIADVQRSAVFLASRGRAFTAFGSVVDSQILTRAFYGYMFGLMRQRDRKSTRLNSSHVAISYAVFCLNKKTITDTRGQT